MKRLPKTFFLNDIPVTMEHRRVRNLNLYIRPPHGDVLVTVPWQMSEAVALDFINSKESWIREHRRKYMEAASDQGEKREPADRTVTEEQQRMLQEKIRFFALKWEPVMGVHCTRWTIRDMVSRWGSCSVQKRTIRINLQLAKFPDDSIEYVVVHELTHLLEPSHNHIFKDYLKKFLPDYREREKYLAQHTVR